MEGGVEDGDVGDALEDPLARLDAAEVRRHVQGAELDELVELRHDALRDDDGVRELLGAVEDAVADGVDVLRRVAEVGDDLFEGFRVVGGAAASDALDEPLREALFPAHVEELVFERTRARVDDQYFPDFLLFHFRFVFRLLHSITTL